MAELNEQDGKEFPDLDNDSELTLTHIDSGCIVYKLDEKIHTMIKDSEETVSEISRGPAILVRFNAIMKSEFPSIHMDIRLRTENGESNRYEYFFMAESESDMDILKTIIEYKSMELHFYTSKIYRSFHLEFEENESTSLERSFDEISPLLTKMSG